MPPIHRTMHFPSEGEGWQTNSQDVHRFFSQDPIPSRQAPAEVHVQFVLRNPPIRQNLAVPLEKRVILSSEEAVNAVQHHLEQLGSPSELPPLEPVTRHSAALQPVAVTPAQAPVDTHEFFVHPLTSKEPNPEDLSDLEELDQFAKNFKERRIKLGYTQGDVGAAIGHMCGNDFSQTTISRFETLNLSFKNMFKLKPLLERWLEQVDETFVNPNGPPPDQTTLRRRKKRTSIEDPARTALESAFLQGPKPSAEEMAVLAETLGLEREVVRVWFCNRRQKERKIAPDPAAALSAVGSGQP